MPTLPPSIGAPVLRRRWCHCGCSGKHLSVTLIPMFVHGSARHRSDRALGDHGLGQSFAAVTNASGVDQSRSCHVVARSERVADQAPPQLPDLSQALALLEHLLECGLDPFLIGVADHQRRQEFDH
jgi:hypothetical protein